MKNLSRLLVLLVVVMLSCKEDDEFSPASITLSENEGWVNQRLLLEFDNPEFKTFEVQFGTTKVVGLADHDGMTIVVPALATDTEYPITVKTPNGVITAKENFLVKSAPSFKYAAPTTFSHRVPLKVIIKNKDYYSDIYATSFCKFSNTQLCWTAAAITSGDTLIFKELLEPGTYVLKLQGNLSFDADVDSESEVKAMTDISMGELKYRASYFLMTTSAKAGGNLDILFNANMHFPDELKITMTNAAGATFEPTYVSFDIAGGAGYISATAGRFKVPTIAVGQYTVTVADQSGNPFLSEKPNIFTVTN